MVYGRWYVVSDIHTYIYLYTHTHMYVHLYKHLIFLVHIKRPLAAAQVYFERLYKTGLQQKAQQEEKRQRLEPWRMYTCK